MYSFLFGSVFCIVSDALIPFHLQKRKKNKNIFRPEKKTLTIIKGQRSGRFRRTFKQVACPFCVVFREKNSTDMATTQTLRTVFLRDRECRPLQRHAFTDLLRRSASTLIVLFSATKMRVWHDSNQTCLHGINDHCLSKGYCASLPASTENACTGEETRKEETLNKWSNCGSSS